MKKELGSGAGSGSICQRYRSDVARLDFKIMLQQRVLSAYLKMPIIFTFGNVKLIEALEILQHSIFVLSYMCDLLIT
jgi:hypothetical protein